MNIFDFYALMTELETSRKVCSSLTYGTQIELARSRSAIRNSQSILAQL